MENRQSPTPKYRVLEVFKDKDGHIYKSGSAYPYTGEAKPERVTALLGDNKYKRPFIKEAPQG